MIKIGIITILRCNNYGAELQAFATQKKIELMGYDAEIIDYLYYKHPHFKPTKASSPINISIKNRCIEFIKYRILNPLIEHILPIFIPAQKRRNQKFNSFHELNTKLSPQYRSYEKLYQNHKNYDVYMVGSDQVWNPYTGTNLAPYFLTFAPQNAPKIAYASSFGVSQIPEKLIPQYKTWLNFINSLSVREEAGIKIIKQITGRDAELVIDPTLLLNSKEWEMISSTGYYPEGDYILIYQVSYNKFIVDFAKYLSQINNNIPVYSIVFRTFLNHKDAGIQNITDAGPADFVSLISHAKLVVTSSFHGTAFSINLKKQFFTILNRNGKRNSRITSLLKQLDLSERIIYDDSDLKSVHIVEYNTENTQKKLSALRASSETYIDNAISSFKNYNYDKSIN